MDGAQLLGKFCCPKKTYTYNVDVIQRELIKDTIPCTLYAF